MGYLKRMLKKKFYLNRISSFEKFVNDKCSLSLYKYTKETISTANAVYDTYIVGSDQVFNKNLTDNDEVYFLNFALPEQTKIGYAVSLGSYKFAW